MSHAFCVIENDYRSLFVYIGIFDYSFNLDPTQTCLKLNLWSNHVKEGKIYMIKVIYKYLGTLLES